MSTQYGNHYNTRQTSQSEPIPGKNQVENSAGGYGFAVDDWARLDRFLVLGSEGGSYYAGEKELTVENAEAVRRCIQSDGIKTVKRIVEISKEGRAPKNDPALFALAMASASCFANEDTRKEVYKVLSEVARIGTHLFQFMEYRKAFAGRGQGFHKAIQRWYSGKEADKLAYQLVKYRQRGGWSHRDVLRICRPKHHPLFAWAVNGAVDLDRGLLPGIITGFEAAQRSEKPKPNLITDYNLPREALPTEWLKDKKVWEALLVDMPMTAMIRNLGNMGKAGLLAPMSEASKTVCERLKDVEKLRKARIHPLSVLVALKTYEQGHGERGRGEWVVVPQVVDALDEAFYLAFQNVEPTGKRHLLALDVSGSMGMDNIAGMPGITPRYGAAAMSLITAMVEANYHAMAFSGGFVEFPISHKVRLDGLEQRMRGMPFDRTDCALPMLYALKNKIPVDAFLVYTDSETWAGSIHPTQALDLYRQKMGISAKLIVVGMVSNGFSIADPNDGGMMDVVGFDTAVPRIMADFIREN